MDPSTNAHADQQATPAERRRERLREEMRETILAAARQLLDERGATGLTMRGVAEAIGYSPAALYEYFPSKQDLLRALFFAGSEGLAGRIEAAVEAQGPEATALERIAAAGWAYREFALANPDLYLLIFSQRPAGGPHVTELSQEELRHAPAFSSLLGLVVEGVEAGALGEYDPLDVAIFLWSFVHGFVMLELIGQTPGPREQRDNLFRVTRSYLASGLLATTTDNSGSTSERKVNE